MIAGLHVRYNMRPCMGNLVFSHHENILISNKVIEKSFFRCSKCGDIVSVIIMPSYEQYILMRRIKVSDKEFERVRDRYRGG